MTGSLSKRLDQILPKITSDAFLSSQGIGNEIACYIFDYPASEELEVRQHIAWMLERLKTHHSALRVLHLDLLDVVLAYLEGRGLYEKVLKMQETKGDAALLRSLKGPVAAEKIRDFIASECELQNHDLILLTGVGSVWPMLRAHNLLSCLHTVMGQTPLVMFYPGSFDGTTLRLFDRLTSDVASPGGKPYYRAFTLVPRETLS